MSNGSIQTSSAGSPPTSATSVPASLELTSGCIHLAEHAQSSKQAKQDFVKNLADARSRATKADNSPPSALHYHCVQCPESGDAIHIETHYTRSQHAFSFSAPSSALYCAECKDTIYVKSAKNSATNGISGKKRTSSEANGDDSYINANSAQRPCGRENVRGLFNLGHTCYMNAVIQTMVHNSLLSSFFLGKGHPVHACPKNEVAEEEEEKTPCVACSFTEIFSESRVAENTQPMAALAILKASWLAIPVRELYFFASIHVDHHPGNAR